MNTFPAVVMKTEIKTEYWVTIYESHDSDLIIFVILFANSNDGTGLMLCPTIQNIRGKQRHSYWLPLPRFHSIDSKKWKPRCWRLIVMTFGRKSVREETFHRILESFLSVTVPNYLRVG